ncbi:MAG: hypothetical protein ACRD1L_04755 [Terriglobales bacterium]
MDNDDEQYDQPDEGELKLQFVPPGEREAVRHFEHETEAKLAAGYLRANGLAAEVETMMMPGLQYSLALWVRRGDAPEARRLLDAADATAAGPQPLD